MTNFTIEDLAMAYRKAKVDIFYSSNARRIDLLAYESDLERNLHRLLDRLDSDDENWLTSHEFLGGAYLVPKSAAARGQRYAGGATDDTVTDRWSDSLQDWQKATSSTRTAELSFRVMAKCSIDFHVLSSLWIMKVGSKFEAMLPESARGNRLRRTAKQEFNLWASGSFGPYLQPYRNWRDEGLEAARNALGGKQNVVVITTDIASYYHSIDPRFLLQPDYRALLGIDLDAGEELLHKRFVDALIHWPEAARAALGFIVEGLPVGLPASGVVANLALIELDRLIEAEVRPLYYGRYVDDIILIMRDGPQGVDGSDPWLWLHARLDGMLAMAASVKRIERSYLQGSCIELSRQKTKVFHLSGSSGLALIGSIEAAIQERSSEWRSLPSIPDEPSQISVDIAQVFQSDGERADSFRGADLMTARRSAFALRLRDYEAYASDLESSTWSELRWSFFDAVLDYVVSLPGYFELAQYVPRVLRMAVACQDYEYVERILKQLTEVRDEIKNAKSVKVQGARKDNLSAARVANSWAKQVADQFGEDLAAAAFVAPAPGDLQKIRDAAATLSPSPAIARSVEDLGALFQSLFMSDLAQLPFRSRYMSDAEMNLEDFSLADEPSELAAMLGQGLQTHLRALVELLGRYPSSRRRDEVGIPSAFAFATRPFGLFDLFLLAQPFHGDWERYGSDLRLIESAILALRGYDVNGLLPKTPREDFLRNELVLSREILGRRKRVALGMIKTSGSAWAAAVNGTPDRSHTRYKALNDTLSDVLRSPRSVDYFVLPELSVPAPWFRRYAYKLRTLNVGFIAGVEYLHAERNIVRNQVWASLPISSGEFPVTFLHRQDKQKAAFHEREKLYQVAGKTLVPEVEWDEVPVIHHEGFTFALLVCSELTNIEYRSQLRGRVDALVSPAWNRDLTTFSALVESAALDMHAYVFVANDRAYGDSRVRAPMREEWRRDLLRVRGGVENYVVMTDLDIPALRAHHNSHSPDSDMFKPLPDGFIPSKLRQALPATPRGM